MNHRLIQPRAKNVTPILASTDPRIGWAVVAGLIAGALLLAVCLAAGAVSPFFTTTVLAVA